MANKRVFYATKKAGLSGTGVGNGVKKFQQLHGLQSVGMTTTFNLEQAFELGQLAIYENIEGIPDVSIEIEKVLDGYCPIYVLATSINGVTSSSEDGKSSAPSLIGRSRAQSDFAMSIYKDTDELAYNARDAADNEGHLAESHVVCSGVFVNSVSYNVGVDGNATESVSLVGQDKVWYSQAKGHTRGGATGDAITWSTTDLITTNDDEPLALRSSYPASASGGVNRREDVLFSYANSSIGKQESEYPRSGIGTVLPTHIPGINTKGQNKQNSDGTFKTHLQSFSCSSDFGREDIFELGRKGRYHRFLPFPTEVTCEVTIISTSGDLISSTEAGHPNKDNTNLTDQTIRLHMREGLIVDLGRKNKLSSVSVTGGDAGGGNEEITYSYTNFNDMTVFHPQDPNYGTVAFRALNSVYS
tara:strand:+ start:117 stop:1361 length:1245 start_codon:yes stop_codon:yes gene_type:complete